MKRLFLFAAIAAVVCSCTGASSGSSAEGNAAIDNIMSRKSVRTYTDQAISDEDMTLMLKAAMAAPSGMNIQPWSFVVLRDKSEYARLFEGNFNLPMFERSAALVVVCADTTISRPSRQDPNVMESTPNPIWRDDMGACTENLLLAAESLGIGAVWTACYPDPVRYMPTKVGLGLPDTVVPYCVVSMGYPGGDDAPKDKFKPERIHYDRW